jgi:hypothetical protein
MKASIEREDFSERLQHALRSADYSPDSPTQLAREFNIRFSGRPITVHAARKWLVGEAIPTQEKLRTLAHWLGVAAEWLRFGGVPQHGERHFNGNGHVNGHGHANGHMNGHGDGALLHARFESEDVKLIADLQRLNEHDRMLAREMIRLLVRISRNKHNSDL